MNFFRLSLPFLAIVLGYGQSIDAMKPSSYKIMVHNTMEGTYADTALVVTYKDASGNEVSRVVSAGEIMTIGSSDKLLPGLQGGYGLKFAGYGDFWSKAIKPTFIDPNFFDTERNVLKANPDQPLIITVTAEQPSMFSKYVLKISYAKDISEDLVRKYDRLVSIGNPLSAFGRIKYWKLDQVLSLPEILGLPNNPKLEVETAGLIQGATTLEDVSRYILGLEKDYSAADIKRASDDLNYLWSPQSVSGKKAQAFAQKLLSAVAKARQVLYAALKAKGSLDEDWIELEVENEQQPSGAVSSTSSSQN